MELFGSRSCARHEYRENKMSSYLWKVTTKKQVGKLPAGASVEIIKRNTNAKPSQREINEAYNAKYSVDGGSLSTSYYDIQLCK